MCQLSLFTVDLTLQSGLTRQVGWTWWLLNISRMMEEWDTCMDGQAYNSCFRLSPHTDCLGCGTLIICFVLWTGFRIVGCWVERRNNRSQFWIHNWIGMFQFGSVTESGKIILLSLNSNEDEHSKLKQQFPGTTHRPIGFLIWDLPSYQHWLLRR